MGMDPADDPDRANPRRQYAGSREEATEELEIEIDASEDVEPLQTAPSPELPSAKVVEEHRHLHIPYRDWCKFCVLGRGTGLPHGRGGSSWIPQVGIDHFYITAGGVVV